MAKIIFIALLCSISIAKNSYAQNLVPNNSFEAYTSCPNNFSQINRAFPWYDPTGATSDYYNACDTGIINVPYCGTGFQWSRTGVAHAGIWGINGFGSNYREYIQIQLAIPLESDSCYKIEFYCNLDNHSGYSINKISAYLSNTPINTVGPGTVLSFTPQINSIFFLSDTIGWMKIDGFYQANGGENYITIGNFNPDNSTDTLFVGGSSYPGAYYMIDDISLEKVLGCDTTTAVNELNRMNVFSIYPNPSDDYFIINSPVPGFQLTIFDIAGKLVLSETINQNQTKIPVQHLENGIYFLRNGSFTQKLIVQR